MISLCIYAVGLFNICTFTSTVSWSYEKFYVEGIDADQSAP